MRRAHPMQTIEYGKEFILNSGGFSMVNKVRFVLWPCLNCGHENPPETNVCENCGSPSDDTGDSGDNRDSEDLFFDDEYL